LWQYTVPGASGEAVKAVEDNSGHVYALIRTDSICVVKLQASDGKLIWIYKQAATQNTRCVDLAVNQSTGLLIASISDKSQLNAQHNAAVLIELDLETGGVHNQHLLEGDLGTTQINAIVSGLNTGFIYGGYTADSQLGGLNGLLVVNKNSVSPVADSCNLVADYRFNTLSGDANFYQFTSITMADSSAKYKWHFGTTDSSAAENPQYRFPGNGTYSVSLTVSTSQQCSSTVTKVIRIESQQLCDYTPSFSYMVDTIGNGRVIFSNSTRADAATYSWDFGDGSVDTVKNPVHQYRSPGYYRVCLRVQTPGCVKTDCQSIEAIREAEKIEVIPNPVTNTARLYLVAENAGPYMVTLMDGRGNILNQFPYTAVQGPNYITLNVAGLLPGIYIIAVTNGTQQELTRFIKI
jgi:PKD repeat protein